MKKLLEFQSDAINELVPVIGGRRRKPLRKPIVIALSAPTGTGKTVMLSQIIIDAFADACVIFMSPGTGGLVDQTRAALRRYMAGTGRSVMEMTSATFSKGANPGDVFVENWESFTHVDDVTGKYTNIFTREGERANFWDLIDSVVARGIPVVVVIDEAHYGKKDDTSRVYSFLKDLNGRIRSAGGSSPLILEATATPITNRIFPIVHNQEVSYEDGMRAGLLRSHILVNHGIGENPDGLAALGDSDAETVILEAALDRQRRLTASYAAMGSIQRPLIGIQMENGSHEEAMKRVESILCDHGITEENGRLLVFMSNRKTDGVSISSVKSPKSPVDVVIYKQAISTGWDCPRAQIFVGFRHMSSEPFKIQNLGRYLRTTEARTYTPADSQDFAALNSTYIYTNKNNFDVQRGEEELEGITGADVHTDSRRIIISDAVQPFVNDYNSHRFPMSCTENTVNRRIGARIINTTLTRVSKSIGFHPDPTVATSTDDLMTGSMDAEEFSEGRTQGMERLASVVRTGSEEINEWYLGMLENALDRRNVDQYASIARRIASPIIELARRSDGRFDALDGAEIKRRFRNIGNQAEVKRLVDKLVDTGILSTGQTPTAPQTSLVAAGAHTIEHEIYVSATSAPIEDFKVPYSLYHWDESAGIAYTVDRSHRSTPEYDFENTIIGGIDGFDLVAFHKNPTTLQQNGFALGVSLKVFYRENGSPIQSTTFYPDYLLFLRSRATGEVRPALIEVKGSKSYEPDAMLEAKARAARSYMRHTGLIFGVMREQRSRPGMFNEYLEGDELSAFIAANWDRPMKRFPAVESGASIPANMNWMRNLGLS